MARPTSVNCATCGAPIPVAARGRIPTRCPDCRTGTPASTTPPPQPEWPKRIGACVWQLEDGTVIYPGQPWPVERR